MDEFEFGTEVRVDLSGRIVGGTDFPASAYLIEHERDGEVRREWIAAERLVCTGTDQIEQKGNANV